jgi:spermidine synthase
MGALNLSPATACKTALLVMGGTATAAQILIIRELLVAFYGSELAIGIILANWLLLEASGSFWARRRAEFSNRYVSVFAMLQVCIGLGCILSILFIRSFKFAFHFSTGEILGLEYVFIISLLALAPVAIPDGVLFPLGCKGLAQVSRGQQAAGRVYLYQALGSFGAALCFVFLLIAWFNSFELASILFIINCGTAYLYLSATDQPIWMKKSVALILLLLLGMVLLGGNSRLHEFSSRLVWYEHDLQSTKNSVYANIAVISKDDQFTFFANGMPYATTPQPPALVEEKAHLPMLFHPFPKKVLVIGGGAGGFLNEILKHPVKKIDYAEQDPLIISSFKQFATPLTDYELHHDGVAIHPQEGRLFLKKTSEKYNLIMVNFPVPSTLLLNRYYTIEFFRLVRDHLVHNGLFSISLPGSETFLSKELMELNRTIYASLKEVFPYVRILVGNDNIYLGANQENINGIGPEVLVDRLLARNIRTSLISGWYLKYKLDPERFGSFVSDIEKYKQQRLNKDQEPKAVIKSMVFLNMISSPFIAAFLTVSENVPFSACLVLIGVAVIVMTIYQLLSRNQPYIMTAIISSGFTGMFMNITLILAFQISYGNVYHYIGLLISSFMFGLAFGSYLAMKMTKPLLFQVEVAIVIHIFLAYVFFAAEPEGLLITAVLIYTFSFISGALTGAEYPLAVSLSNQSGKSVSINAGKLYAIDLIGAFGGAILTAIFLLPVLGIKNSLLIIIIMKAGSLVMTCLGERKELIPGGIFG